jgi:hypothetical protein
MYTQRDSKFGFGYNLFLINITLMIRLLGLFLFVSFSCAALELKYCEISDLDLHAANQRHLKEIVEQELASLSPKISSAEKGRILTRRIGRIAERLIEIGFFESAYAVPEADSDTLISFDCFPLWEGKSIPATFLVYVWPSEEYALAFNSDHPKNTYYGSIIHSHPISCAFTVLKGSLSQGNYVLASADGPRTVRLVDEDLFYRFEGSIDDLKQPFIHRLYSKGMGKTPTLSLHVYSLPTEEKVMASFKETRDSHSYELQTAQ